MNMALRTFQRAGFDVFLGRKTPGPDSVRCLPELIHFNAIHNPHKTFCKQKKSLLKLDGGIESIEVTFIQLAQAIERCCEWILTNVDTSAAEYTSDGSIRKAQPIALLLESDLGLFIYLAALLTLNIPCLLLSIRLNSQAVGHLLKQTGCNCLIASPRTAPGIRDILNEDSASDLGYRMIDAVTFEEFLAPAEYPSSSLSRLPACAQMVREDDRNVLILHSSGTTGLPKAIPLAHRYLLGYAGCHEFPAEEDMSRCGYNLSTLPLYHGFGLLAPSLSLSIGKPVWFPPSDTIPNGSLVISLLKSSEGKITSLMTVPTILEDITLMGDVASEAVLQLAQLDFVLVGGGGIKPIVGANLASRAVTLLNHFGATELGALSPVFQPDEHYDWRYLQLRTDLGLRLERVEAQNASGYTRICKLIGHPFAWNTEFELQDRLEFNPKKPDSQVTILGRNDDLIALATGEKVVPHLLERHVEQHPLVRRAIVFGHGQFEIGILLEPVSEHVESASDLIDAVWPTVLEANDLMDTHCRISSKSAIILKHPDKEIPLTDKGSVRRREVYSIFEPEITAVYTALMKDDGGNIAFTFDPENLIQHLKEVARTCLPSYNKTDALDENSDFIALGMDSLQATRYRRILQASLRKSGYEDSKANNLPLDIIYSHSSISALANALNHWIRGSSLVSDSVEKMKDLVGKYACRHEAPSLASGSKILITGSTGNLGANLLRILSEDERTCQLICLLRSSSVSSTPEQLKARQESAFQDRGITLSSNGWSKIKFLPILIGVDRFGMTEDDFQNLASGITHIFHGAWPMDFKVKVQSLEPQMLVVQELLQLGRLAHASRPTIRPRIVLASSIAVVGRYPLKARSSVVPEVLMDDPETPLPIGYAEAKWVCEKVMESAYDNMKEVEPTIVRIGQLSGSRETGFWSSKEHLPALIKASQAIGAMPDLQGSLSWIPVDEAAQVISEILLGNGRRELVYHLENPTRQPWPEVCSIIEHNTSLESKKRLPFPQWLYQFSISGESSKDLLDFFQNHFQRMSSGSLVLDTGKSKQISSTLNSMGIVPRNAIESYIRSWRTRGFLD